jgi:hypothetical protein
MNSIQITLKNNQKFSNIKKLTDLYKSNGGISYNNMSLEIKPKTTQAEVIEFFASRGLAHDRFVTIEDRNGIVAIITMCDIASVEMER